MSFISDSFDATLGQHQRIYMGDLELIGTESPPKFLKRLEALVK